MDDFKKVIDGLLCDVYPQYIEYCSDYITAQDIDGNTLYLCDIFRQNDREFLGTEWFSANHEQSGP